MTENQILTEFKTKVNREIEIKGEGKNRYVVNTPFMFEDGDHIPVILKKDEKGWLLSDEGHIFMHVSYDEIDFEKGTRKKIIDNALSSFGMEDRSGELISRVEEDEFGNALFSYLQGVLKVTDISFLNKERVKSTFYEDWKALIEARIPAERTVFDFVDKKSDPKGHYPIDCKINGMKRPLFVFAISNDDKCRDATITCYHYEKNNVPFIGVGVFENIEEINRKVHSRFCDVSEKQFSTLESAKERFKSYFENANSK